MNFGSLQSVTAWRLTRSGAATCQGIVVHGPGGFRLVVIQDQQIVEWTRVGTAAALREHVRTTVRKLRQAGWRATGPIAGSSPSVRGARRAGCSAERHGLLTIAEQVSPQH
jgi:hypothetical protein